MKKFIAMLLALVMVLSLVACGDKKDDAAGTDDSEAWISPPARTPC